MPVFDTPGGVTLEIRLPAGHVTVKTADVPSTEVELIPHGRRGEEALEQIVVSAREQPGGHVVSVEQRDRFRWGPISINWGHEVEIRITCPLGSDLRFDGASCDLGAAGQFGKVEAKTASGDLRLGEISGKLQAKTASGDVSVQVVEAEAAVVTVSGDVELGRVDAALNTRTVSGTVELGVVRAPVAVATTSGDVAVRAVERGEVRVQTVSGEARLGVAEGTAVWLDASSVSGELRSELGVLEEKISDSSGDVVPLHVKTVSGDVTFVRAVVGAGA
jgi:Putative adhesin